MAVDVVVPDDFWEGNSEGAISAWFFADGDQVEEGDLIAEVMYEKTASELLAPASGQLAILIPAEQAVTKGQVVARISA